MLLPVFPQMLSVFQAVALADSSVTTVSKHLREMLSVILCTEFFDVWPCWFFAVNFLLRLSSKRLLREILRTQCDVSSGHAKYNRNPSLCSRDFHLFSTRDSCTGRYCWERVLAMGILSVCPSVMTRDGFKPRWDRDSGSSPYDSLDSLVSYEVIWCHWVRRFPSNEDIKQGYPPWNRYLPLLAHVAWKRLQIDTDFLIIITSTADELSSGTDIDDLERPWTPKIGVFSEFLAIFDCNTHFKSELRRNHSR